MILDLLTESTNYSLFPLIVRYKASNRVEFVLQTLRCPDSVRVGAVLVCDARKLQPATYVERQASIPSHEVRAALDVAATRRIYDHLFAVRASEDDDPATHGDPSRLGQLAHYNRSAVLDFLNDKFLTPTSPSWFLNAYGGHEGTALLSMSYYLFERQLSTIQTTRGYTLCYTSDPGDPIPTHVTMREFMTTLLRSRFRKEVERFARYARARNARDGREIDHVDAKIDEFREASRLPADTAIYYAYLAYSTALSRERILQYCARTEFDPGLRDEDQCRRDENFLGRRLDDDLLRMMKEYFSPEAYFRNYVEVERLAAPPDAGYEGYDWEPDAASGVRVFFGSSAAVLDEILRLNDKTEDLFDPVPQRTLPGLLRLCASGRSIPLEDAATLRRATRRNYLMNTSRRAFGPLPAFRVEMPGPRSLFVCLSADEWLRRLVPPNLDRDLPRGHALSDEDLTETLWPREEVEARQKFWDQLYRTRHEIFNEHLPVFNFVGDLDLKLRDRPAPGIRRRDFFDLLRDMRRALLDAWAQLFPDDAIDRDAYPVYFFKSACDDPGPDAAAAGAPDAVLGGGGGAVFCTCRRKIGMRIVIPLPRGTVALGSTTVKRLARTLDHALCLDRDLVGRLNAVSNPGDCFDTGVYGHGRSVRMPLMYKLDASGYMLCRRLNPVYVVPPKLRAAPHDFVRAHFRPENLTHHGNPHGGDARVSATIVHIADRACGEEDVSFTQKYINRDERRPQTPLLPTIRQLLAATRREASPGPTLPPPRARTGDGDDGGAAAAAAGPDDLDDGDDDPTDAGPPDPEEARDLETFAREVAWPRVLELARGHYRPEAQAQLEAADVFRAVRRDLLAVKRDDGGRGRDFRCLTTEHHFRWRETVNVFLDLRADRGGNVWATLWSRCFANKCQSNARRTHLTVKISPPSQY